ncbi:hypothetical protein BDZ88DRAFT_19478 [Geranomyces variabilis]|nr:hypothetical protein BDZ88DRAFT_19478 [Geranomyces variabilis]KAJ3140031.1 hypothetical protein HDU90_008935 [Geranomyces variabilis]
MAKHRSPGCRSYHLHNNGTVAINEACDMVDESTLENPWIYTKPPVYLRHVNLVRYLWRNVNDVFPVRNANNTFEPSDRLFPHMLMRLPIQVLEEPAAYDGVSLLEQRAKYMTDMIICRKLRDHDDCVRSNKNLVNSFCESINQPFHRMLRVKEPDLPDGTLGPVDSYYVPALLFPDYLHVLCRWTRSSAFRLERRPTAHLSFQPLSQYPRPSPT